MDILLIIGGTLIVILLIVVLVICLRRKANSNGKDVFGGVRGETKTKDSSALELVQEKGIAVQIERLLATTEFAETNLFEITDHTVIARISQTIPAAANIVEKMITNKAIQSVELYKAIIPSGATLAKSKQTEGGVRAFFHGSKGIKGHADLVKVDPTNISKASSVASGAANVMNVASLVVGQYYMSEINSKLETMNKNIDKISDFQDMEFKSRILSLLSRVGEISQFSSEIMEQDDQRNIKLAALENLKGVATELLGQVNLTITGITQKNPNPSYQEYQKHVSDLQTLIGYQNVLVTVLEEISKLIYILGRGSISSDLSYSLFNKYLQHSTQNRNLLEQWHDRQVESLQIDLDKNRISKTGVEGFFSAIPGVVDKKWKYKELKNDLEKKINAQINTNQFIPDAPKDVYAEDVQIIIKNGKYFYLHESQNQE